MVVIDWIGQKDCVLFCETRRIDYEYHFICACPIV